MAKVSGALKTLIKKIIYIKNLNLNADDEKAIFDGLRLMHPVNYHLAMGKSIKEPWSRRLK